MVDNASDGADCDSPERNNADFSLAQIPVAQSVDEQLADTEAANEQLAADRVVTPARTPQDIERNGLRDAQTASTTLTTSADIGGGSLTAVAPVDPAVPAVDSAFMDARDPMVSADGHRPTKTEIIRLGVGFTIASLSSAIPWVALSTIILPRVFEIINPTDKVMLIGVVNAVGSIVALLANIIFGTLSDLTRSRFGKRTPWMIIGGLIAGISIGSIAFVQNEWVIIVLWCCAQLGYNMLLAPFIATMSDRVPDKVRGTISGFYGGGTAVGQTLGSLVGASLLQYGSHGIFAAWMLGLVIFGIEGFFIVFVWPREQSNLDEPRVQITPKTVLLSFRPPRHAPDFYYALAGRTLMMGGYWMITTYQLYIAQDYIFAGQAHATEKSARIIAVMSVITLVVALVAAVTAGPITDRLNRRKVPVALASCLFAFGSVMPLIWRSPWGMFLFAGIAGLGYGIYNAIDQALNVAVLPNPKEAGKDLGILNLANTLSTVIGSLLTSIVVSVVKSIQHVSVAPVEAYSAVFIVSIVIVLIAAGLIMRIKHVQ